MFAKRLLPVLLALVLAFALAGCSKKDPYADVPPPIATITMEDGSIMRFQLSLMDAPNTVANFTKLANDGFYDHLTFFKVVPGVLIQSGDPRNDGSGGADYTIRGEFSKNGRTNKLSHQRGTISMARLVGETRESYNSGSSQFFIMQGNYPEYDGYYAAFGTALDAETLEVIDAIASQPVDGSFRPLRSARISTIRVETHGYEFEPETIEKKD